MKGSATQGTGRYHIQAEINMIPLIDVALVLLIIFMLISPLLVESQILVNLPNVTQAPQADESAIKVQISKDGTFIFKGDSFKRIEFKKALGRYLPPGHRASLLIQADKDVAFDDVVYVMDVAKQLKIEKLGVSVLPEMFQ